MISVDIIRDGEDEPTWSIDFEQAPAVGDQIYVHDGLAPANVTFEVLRRQWYANPNRRSPVHTVIVWVREVQDELEPDAAEFEQAVADANAQMAAIGIEPPAAPSTSEADNA